MSDEELAQLASEVHSGLAQLLVAARLKIGLLKMLATTGSVPQILDETDALLGSALEDTRRLITRLEGRQGHESETTSDTTKVGQEAPAKLAEGSVESRTIRVLLADDHPALRRVLRRILETDDSIQLVAEAVSGQEAVELACQHQPDVVLMDVNMAGMNGLDAAREIAQRAPQARVVGLSATEDHAAAMIACGAAAFVRKGCSIAELLTTIRAVAAPMN